MNWFNVSIHLSLLFESSITNSAFERLFSFMNWWNVSVCKASITYAAFERLYYFMNCRNMIVQISPRVQNCTTNGAVKWLFSSWTDTMYPFKCHFYANLVSQIVHLKGFYPSWVDAICPLKCPLTNAAFERLFSFLNWSSMFKSLFWEQL